MESPSAPFDDVFSDALPWMEPTGAAVPSDSLGDEDEFAGTPLWAVGDLTEQVVSLYQAGAMEEAKAGRALAALTVVGPDGTKWCLGATTRRWYRKAPVVGAPWRLTRAPSSPEDLRGPASEAIRRAMSLLGVDPDTIPEQAPAAAPTVSDELSLDSEMTILDQLVDGLT